MYPIHRLVYAALAASSLAVAPAVRAADSPASEAAPSHMNCGERCPCQHANGSDAEKSNSKEGVTVKFEAPQHEPAWVSGP